MTSSTRFLVALSLFFVVACSNARNQSAATSDATSTTQSLINSISGALDDTAGEALSAQNVIHRPGTNPLKDFFSVPIAQASSCSRSWDSCNAGVASRHVDCDLGSVSWKGDVSATFTDGANAPLATCAAEFGDAGDSILYVANVKRNFPAGSIERTSSHTNYLGATIAGGVKFSRPTALGYQLEILGASYIVQLAKSSSASYVTLNSDVSVKTTRPLSVNQLDRAGRVISGELDVYDNIGKITYKTALNDLTWAAGCCYPVSGSIEYSVSGAKTASYSVAFQSSCGSIVVDDLNPASTPPPASSLAYCE